jgi:membrane-bound lytic murein transglycosylase D
MPDTARRYGLFVDETRDDRTDIEKSTRAAARYLRDLHLRFGNWPLALAAYNAGELAVEGAVKRTGSSDFAAISNTGQIPAETRSYVPAVLAAIKRIQDRDWFGSKPMESKPVRVIYASVAGELN